MILRVNQWQRLILMQPLNVYSWYEAAKHGMSLEDALSMAKDRNIPERIIREGFEQNTGVANA